MTQQLNLINAPSILFLFGLAGAGKSYIGDLIAEQTGWYVYHADEDINKEMKKALARQQPFTEQMRHDYFSSLVEKIKDLQQQHAQLVITQAVYKQLHRDFLLQHFPEMKLIFVDATDNTIQQRLKERDHGISYDSAKALRNDFEFPGDTVTIIRNDSDSQNIISQLNTLFS